MKGKYINTVIMMAAKSGRKTKQIVARNETMHSLSDFKIIWSKSSKGDRTVTGKPQAALIA